MSTRRRKAGTSHGTQTVLVFLASAVLVAFCSAASTTRPAAPAGNRLDSAATSAPTDEATSRDVVLIAELADAIAPPTAGFLIGAIERAEARGAACLVIQLDTPGGLDVAMRDVVKRILSSSVPVVVYVAPSGARAASAGLFILLSAHVAAMAPGTNTGAAHPVNLGGGPVDSTMAVKIVNDSASFIRSIAHQRGRNEEWAERAVRESASITADEALATGVVEVLATSPQDLLRRLDGRTVKMLTGEATLRTRDVRLEKLEMGWRERALSKLANPNVAYMLLMLGTMGLLLELYNPGAILPGVVGAISILLAFFALQVLPVNSVGLLLLAVGIILLVLEIKVTSYGLLTIGGVIALSLGALFLFDSKDSLYRVSWSVLIPTVAVTAAFFLFVIGKGLQAQRARPMTGRVALIGAVGIADSVINLEGKVIVNGEYWEALAAQPIAAGSSIEVVGIEGRQLFVRPAPPRGAEAGTAAGVT